MSSNKSTYEFTKRGLDLLISGAALIITSPLQLATWAFVLTTHGSPVLFRQPRPGKDGKVFELVKFRTMLEPTEERQTDEERLTKAGKFLRSTSLDELPTLWNVFKGDMSLVGPRPLLVSYLEHYSSEQARRHEVRPGVTGLAQIYGRNSISWEERFILDVEYVENRSIALDLKIIKNTILSVLKREGINHEGHATMPPFAGTRESEQ